MKTHKMIARSTDISFLHVYVSSAGSYMGIYVHLQAHFVGSSHFFRTRMQTKIPHTPYAHAETYWT
jgi:hypothetical protein